MKRYIRSFSDYEDLEDAILNERPFRAPDYQDYLNEFGDIDEDAIQAKDVKVGDFIENTECCDEVDIGDVIEILEIIENAEGWQDFDYTFRVLDHTLQPPFETELHYMDDEYVGVPVESPIEGSCDVTGAYSSLTRQSLDTSTLVDFLAYQYKGYDGDKDDLMQKLSSKYNKEVANAVCKKIAASSKIRSRGGRMKRYIRSAKILPNKRIQEGMFWDIDGHRQEVVLVDPSSMKCKITENWISEDSGRELEHTDIYKIKFDDTGTQYAESIKYPGYKLYSTSAYNYPILEQLANEEAEDYEDEEDYTPSATRGDYGPSNPWDAPGMSTRDFI